MIKATIWAVPILAASLFMASFASAGPMEAETAPDPLEGLLGEKRPLVVVADQIADPRFQRQIVVLQGRAPALADYDIKLVSMIGDGTALRRKLGLPAAGFAVALVGKDGGVKEIWREPVSPDRIFALIDTMPMRQDEARRKTN